MEQVGQAWRCHAFGSNTGGCETGARCGENEEHIGSSGAAHGDLSPRKCPGERAAAAKDREPRPVEHKSGCGGRAQVTNEPET